LPGRERVGTDLFVALDLRRRHEVLDAVLTHAVAELRVPEFRTADSLLLFLDSPPTLEREANRPLQILLRDLCLRVRVEEFEKPVQRAIDSADVAPAERGAKEHTP
jgi:hypothetical protein